MNMKKKLVAGGLVAALAATAIGGATLAYFTDTDNRTNTFTAAGADGAALDITLTETSENRVVGDVTLNAGTAQENGFKYDNVLPGLAYDKNAVVTLENGSVDSHLYIELVISNYSALMNAIEGVSGIDANALQDSFLVNPNENIPGRTLLPPRWTATTSRWSLTSAKLPIPRAIRSTACSCSTV